MKSNELIVGKKYIGTFACLAAIVIFIKEVDTEPQRYFDCEILYFLPNNNTPHKIGDIFPFRLRELEEFRDPVDILKEML